MASEGEFQTESTKDLFKENTGQTRYEQYHKHHPPILTDFGVELKRCGEGNGKPIPTSENYTWSSSTDQEKNSSQ